MAKRGIESLYNRVGKELHSKKTLDNVPVRWRSAPNHPETQLAYITDEEAALLKKLDIHDSGVRYRHHIGPQGIPSYNGAGSGDSAGGNDNGGGDSTGGSPAGDGGGTMGGGDIGGGGGFGGESGSPAGDTGGVMGGGDVGGGGFGGESGSPAGDTGGVAGGAMGGGSFGGDIGGAVGGLGSLGDIGGIVGGGFDGIGAVGGTDIGSVAGGSSLASAAAGVPGDMGGALGATAAGAFGTSGVVGVDAGTSPASMAAQGISPSTDVSTSLSAMGIGDVSMGAFGPGGIMGTGETEGVSGLGMGASNISGGLGGLGALGSIGPAGFATTESGFSTTGPTSTPFGGAPLSSTPQGYASPSMGMGFGIGPSGVSMGAPYSGADVDTGMLAAGGIPGSRANAIAEQAAQMAAQVAANPTYSAPATMTNQDIAAALRAGGLPSVNTSSLAIAAATPAPSVSAAPAPSVAVSAAPAPSVSPTVSAAPAPSVAPSVSAAPAPSPSPSPSPSVSQTPTATPTAGPTRSASSISAEDVAQPGWGHTAATVAANTALGLFGGIPGLAVQGASYLGTGQSFGANLADVALSGGFAPSGGILGGGFAGYGAGSPPADLGTGSSEGGIGYAYSSPALVAAPVQVAEVINPAAVQRAPVNPYGFNIADFIAPAYYSDSLPSRGYRA